jgi:tetratricopeptide (TPR) repeat protein
MKAEVHKMPAKRHLPLAFIIHNSYFIIFFPFLALSAFSQDNVPVRRAEPVDPDAIPTARAVPFDPFEKPTPAAAAAAPASQPSSGNTSGESTPAPAPPPPREESADRIQLDYANDLYSRAQVDLAAPEYEKYLNLYPDAPLLDRESAFFRLGECYRKIGNVNAAKNSYQTLLLDFAIGQFIGPAAYRLADMCYADKDYEGALNYYRKASVRLTDPAVSLSARFQSARCLEALDLPSEARITYEDIVATKGDNPFREPSRLALAEILSSSGRKEDALVQFEALAKEATQSTVKVEALVKAGLLNIDLGQPDKGAADLNKALSSPDIGQWRNIVQIGLLHVLYQSGKYKQLLDQYQAAYDDLPAENKPEVLSLAANSKREMGDFAGASDLYEQIIKDYPDSVYADDARYQHLVSLYNAGDPSLIPQIDAFLAGKPDPTKRDQVTLLKAEDLFKAGQFADAAPVYASIVDSSTLISSYRSDALLKLAWCYMQTHQPGDAITALSTFLKDYPTDRKVSSALAQRAVASQETHDLNSALKDFDQLLTDYPKAKERELALEQKALILGEQEDKPGMSATFQQLLAEFPHSSVAAEANYWIGAAAYSAKDYKACIPPLEAARKLDKAQYFERATIRIIGAYYTLEDRDSLAAEIDLYNAGHPKDKVQADILRQLGQSYLTAGDFPNAGKYLLQLSARPEAIPDDWLDLGKAQLGARQYPDAIASIDKYLAAQSDPVSQAKGFLVLGQAQLQSGDLDSAQTSADKACSLQPEGLPNAQGRMLSGDIQVARGNNDAAARIYRSIDIIIDDPQISPVALEKAYHCLIALGNPTEAAKVLNELQTKYPEYQLKADSDNQIKSGGLIAK